MNTPQTLHSIKLDGQRWDRVLRLVFVIATCIIGVIPIARLVPHRVSEDGPLLFIGIVGFASIMFGTILEIFFRRSERQTADPGEARKDYFFIYQIGNVFILFGAAAGLLTYLLSGRTLISVTLSAVALGSYFVLLEGPPPH